MLNRSPLAVLIPHVLGLVASTDAAGSVARAVLALLKPHDIPKITASGGDQRALMGIFWGDRQLDALRLRLVIAQWGEVSDRAAIWRQNLAFMLWGRGDSGDCDADSSGNVGMGAWRSGWRLGSDALPDIRRVFAISSVWSRRSTPVPGMCEPTDTC